MENIRMLYIRQIYVEKAVRAHIIIARTAFKKMKLTIVCYIVTYSG